MNHTADNAPLSVREMGSFFAGGRTVTLKDQPCQHVQVAHNGPDRIVDLNGDYITGQCYVQYVRLAEPQHDVPVMFWHGGAMTGATWETTPDGRPGWQTYFLRQGFDTYLCDAVERGRSGWSPYPEIYQDAPIFRTQNEAWELFRIGPPESYDSDPAKRRPYEGQQFPTQSFDRFGAQFVPRWTGHGPQSLVAYHDALTRIGPVWLIAHSQGGNFALEAAARWPERFLGVIVIEPAAAPSGAGTGEKVPHLFVWGDRIEVSPLWTSYREVVDGYANRLRRRSGHVTTLDLPEVGITGNSHLPFMDRNSDRVAALIVRWIEGILGA